MGRYYTSALKVGIIRYFIIFPFHDHTEYLLDGKLPRLGPRPIHILRSPSASTVMHDALSQQGSTYFPCVYQSPIQNSFHFHFYSSQPPFHFIVATWLQLVSVVPEPPIPQTQGLSTKKHPVKMVVKSLTLKSSIESSTQQF